MDLHHKQEVTVGMLVLGGIGLFVVGTMWLKGRSFSSSSDQVRIAFADVGTLKRGSAVRVSGVNLGSVEQIAFEGVGKVVVTVSLKPIVQPKIDATAKLGSAGLMGDALIIFHPGNASQPLPAGTTIQGVVDQGLMEIGTELSGQAKQALTGITEIANKQLADNLNATLNSMQRMMGIYSNTKSGPVSELTATMRQLRVLTEHLDSTLAAANLPRTLRAGDTLATNLGSTSKEFAVTAARFDTLLQKINRGQGSLGKLVTDTTLYAEMTKVTTALKELVDELKKHPGKITIQVKAF
jgi:phospholipid/cholesterol/gamma-HCH transport system substrate-binding protein